MLVDDVTIIITAGKGGDGAATFRQNAQTPRGGPDGGNGGNGGDVYVQGSTNISDLREFRFKKAVKAPDGVSGRRQNLHGRNADDLVVKVPVGTRITEITTGKTYEVEDTHHKTLIAHGGKGGRGNNEFKSATNQAPKYAEKGTEGEKKEVRLELQLIAEVGLIGFPNAGKSSLLEALTNARPKVGDYPFTTLEPNLGMFDGMILADIPGLIAGASEGKGLGLQFLKHIEKTRVLVHCIAATEENQEEAYGIIRHELLSYSKHLGEKPELILLTKKDVVDKETVEKKLKQLQKKGKNVIPVSIYDEESLGRVKQFLTEQKETNPFPA